MKSTLTAFAAVSALAAASGALAQTQVTVYGLIDAGVEYVSNANSNHNSVLRLTSGGVNTSRLGFKASKIWAAA